MSIGWGKSFPHTLNILSRPLTCVEGASLVGLLVEEPVAPAQPDELVAEDAGEGGSDEGALGRPLGHQRREQVDLLNAGVDVLERVDGLRLHLLDEVLPPGGPGQAAHGAPVVVGRDAVVAAALDVERHQVQAERQIALEQPVRHLVREEAVEALARLRQQPAQQVVERVLLVQHERRKLVAVQDQVLFQSAELAEAPATTRQRDWCDEKLDIRATGFFKGCFCLA